MGKVKTFYETETCLQKFCERRSIQLGTDKIEMEEEFRKLQKNNYSRILTTGQP